ncbi:SIMPL domain-containing protein [Tropicimonas marinistellae]|uniref:SIMPL domain-containing protein n=1 Tax=Tropicimonas marinistellae TaxID=1739787 RepID=UPI000833177C|nr:SIMPL domain-containing protein [Tropicimonas marinistellae]
MGYRHMTAAALAVAIGIGAGAALAQENTAKEAHPTLTVSGEGRVNVAPDMAVLRLGVVASDKDASGAVREMSARMGAVLERLQSAGIAERDIQTSSLTVRPKPQRDATRNENGVDLGTFEASTEVTVRLRDLERLGSLLDAVAQDGANLFRGLSFGIQEPETVNDFARRKAVEDAMRRAAVYVDAAGVSLGPILSIEELGGPVSPRMMRAEADGFSGGSVPVAAGELSVTSAVTITYALSPRQ